MLCHSTHSPFSRNLILKGGISPHVQVPKIPDSTVGFVLQPAHSLAPARRSTMATNGSSLLVFASTEVFFDMGWTGSAAGASIWRAVWSMWRELGPCDLP